MTKEELYQKLSEPIPEKFLSKYKATDGTELTTYPAQYAIDLLNENVGYDNYQVIEEIIEKSVYGKAWVVAMKVTISFSKAYVTGYGSEYAKDLDIALKSAKTKAFKHACRFLGIGKELYYDEIIEASSSEEKKTDEEDIIEATDSPSTKLLNTIKASTSVAELDNILAEINGIESEKIKAMLIKKYNDKKIELSE